MPVTHFNVQWPDGEMESCYSPSGVIREHLQTGREYTITEFLAACEAALNEASERVRAKFGYTCSGAMDQLEQIRQRCRQYPATSCVVVVSHS